MKIQNSKLYRGNFAPNYFTIHHTIFYLTNGVGLKKPYTKIGEKKWDFVLGFLNQS